MRYSPVIAIFAAITIAMSGVANGAVSGVDDVAATPTAAVGVLKAAFSKTSSSKDLSSGQGKYSRESDNIVISSVNQAEQDLLPILGNDVKAWPRVKSSALNSVTITVWRFDDDAILSEIGGQIYKSRRAPTESLVFARNKGRQIWQGNLALNASDEDGAELPFAADLISDNRIYLVIATDTAATAGADFPAQQYVAAFWFATGAVRDKVLPYIKSPDHTRWRHFAAAIDVDEKPLPNKLPRTVTLAARRLGDAEGVPWPKETVLRLVAADNPHQTINQWKVPNAPLSAEQPMQIMTINLPEMLGERVLSLRWEEKQQQASGDDNKGGGDAYKQPVLLARATLRSSDKTKWPELVLSPLVDAIDLSGARPFVVRLRMSINNVGSAGNSGNTGKAGKVGNPWPGRSGTLHIAPSRPYYPKWPDYIFGTNPAADAAPIKLGKFTSNKGGKADMLINHNKLPADGDELGFMLTARLDGSDVAVSQFVPKYNNMPEAIVGVRSLGLATSSAEEVVFDIISVDTNGSRRQLNGATFVVREYGKRFAWQAQGGRTVWQPLQDGAFVAKGDIDISAAEKNILRLPASTYQRVLTIYDSKGKPCAEFDFPTIDTVGYAEQALGAPRYDFKLALDIGQSAWQAAGQAAGQTTGQASVQGKLLAPFSLTWGNANDIKPKLFARTVITNANNAIVADTLKQLSLGLQPDGKSATGLFEMETPPTARFARVTLAAINDRDVIMQAVDFPPPDSKVLR